MRVDKSGNLFFGSSQSPSVAPKVLPEKVVTGAVISLLTVHDKIALMLILIPVLVLTATAPLLALLRWTRARPGVCWWLAVSVVLVAWGSIWSWSGHLPFSLTLATWQPLFPGALRWLADGYSWPYALALTTLLLGVLLTSTLHVPANLLAWAGMFLLTALGILSVTAENLLTLILIWSALDLAELVTMLHSTPGDRAGEAIVAFAIRLTGIGLATWAGARTDTLLDFTNMPAEAGLYLLLAAGLRVGVLPLHLPYQQEPVLRRDFGSVLRLVSAASGLAMLARLSSGATFPFTTPLLILLALPALYGGYAWLRASDELSGRPFWVLATAALAMVATLRGNPAGATAWGIGLILGGGLLFLYSARHRALIGLPLLSAFGLSGLPFSMLASGWLGKEPLAWPLWVIFLLAQSLVFGGYLRHASHVGESSIESHPRWAQVIYCLGLSVFPVSIGILGLWGWPGSNTVGLWWASSTTLLLAPISLWLAERLTRGAGVISLWNALPPLAMLYRWLRGVAGNVERLIVFVSELLEGEAGMLWSFLLLVLLASILTQR